METQCKNLAMTQRNKFLKLLQNYEECFDGTCGTWKEIQYRRYMKCFQKGG